MTEMLDQAITTTDNVGSALDQALKLLGAHDDTSKFVGLALLKSLLDNQDKLRNDPVITSRCWDAVPVKFLNRLLRAKENKRKSPEENESLVELAVNIIHIFTLLNPSTAGDDLKLVGRTPALISLLDPSSSETVTRILQTLISFQNGINGTRALWDTDNLSSLYDLATSQPLALDVVKHALFNTVARPELRAVRLQKLDEVIDEIVSRFKGHDASALLELLAELFPRLPLTISESPPTWLRPAAELIQASFISKTAREPQAAPVLLASALLQAYPPTFSSLLFEQMPAWTSSTTTTPFLYVLPSLLAVDLHSTFPSLLEQLASPEYPAISRRLAADFSILSAFLGFLASSMDDLGSSPSLEPDLLLKLRKQFAELSSLTMELLRDRWDAAVSGVAGLHPEARPGPEKRQSGNTPLSLTWDSSDGGVALDPMILAAVQYLALWLREDENENLRREAAGTVDVLLGLYTFDCNDTRETDEKASTGAPNFTSPVLVALEGILVSEEGIEAFQRENGWELLSRDLSTILSRLIKPPRPAKAGEEEEETGISTRADIQRGIEIVRVLFNLIESEWMHPASIRGEWMEMIKPVAALPLPPKSSHTPHDASHTPHDAIDQLILELQISSYQLIASLFDKGQTSLGAEVLKRRYGDDTKRIKDIVVAIVRNDTATIDSQHGESEWVQGQGREIGEQIEGAKEIIAWFDELAIWTQ